MSIAYTYEVVSVDEAARCMEVIYSAEGHQTMRIGARLPYEGEALANVVHMYSPVRYWEEQQTAVAPPEVGATGFVAPPATPLVTLESAKAEKLGEISSWRFERETRGIRFNGAAIKTDRESQATINAIHSSLKDGLITSVDWKTAGGDFITIGLPEVTAIAQAVCQHVQDCFTKERALVEQVAMATSVEAVQDINPSALFPDPFGSIPTTEL